MDDERSCDLALSWPRLRGPGRSRRSRAAARPRWAGSLKDWRQRPRPSITVLTSLVLARVVRADTAASTPALVVECAGVRTPIGRGCDRETFSAVFDLL